VPDDQTQRRPDEPPAQGLSADDAAAPTDEFDNLVLDDDFVRGGTYEPPARTRFAIAHYGDQQTSWRHGGGLRAPGNRSAASRPAGQPAGPRRERKNRSASARSGESRLPLIITAVVVVVFAILLFR
jgi:hypothetical protein